MPTLTGRTKFVIRQEQLDRAQLTAAALSALTDLSYNKIWRWSHGGANATADEIRLVTQVLDTAAAFESLKGSR